MGGSESKTAVSQLSQQISDIAMSTVQSCEVSSQQEQTLVVNNTGWRLWGSYSLEQKTDIKSECFSDVQKQMNLQNSIINAISQAVTAENVALIGAFGKSNAEAVTNLTNIVRNNITMSNIQNSYTQIRQKQSATFNNSGIIGFEQVELTQGSKLFAAATLAEVDKAGIMNNITSYVDQSSKASVENPLDFIAKAIGTVSDSINSTIMLFVIIIAIAIFGLVFIMKIFDVKPRDVAAITPQGRALRAIGAI